MNEFSAAVELGVEAVTRWFGSPWWKAMIDPATLDFRYVKSSVPGQLSPIGTTSEDVTLSLLRANNLGESPLGDRLMWLTEYGFAVAPRPNACSAEHEEECRVADYILLTEAWKAVLTS